MKTKKEKNQYILSKIKSRDFDFEEKAEIFNLIEENIDRIEFVKDHIGVRDFLFIAEESTRDFFTSNLFCSIDVEFEEGQSEFEKEEAFAEKYEENLDEVIYIISEFFQENDRTLFIGIGFEENTNRDLRSKTTTVQTIIGEQEISLYEKEILKLLSSGAAETEQEASKLLRKFPDWYEEVGKDPVEIVQKTVKEEIREIEENKAELMLKINEALDKNNKEEFLTLTEQLKKYK